MTRLMFPVIPTEVMTHHNDSTGQVSIWLVKDKGILTNENNYTCIIGFLEEDFIPEDVMDLWMLNAEDINWIQELHDAMGNKFVDCTTYDPEGAIGGAIVQWYEKVHKETL